MKRIKYILPILLIISFLSLEIKAYYVKSAFDSIYYYDTGRTSISSYASVVAGDPVGGACAASYASTWLVSPTGVGSPYGINLTIQSAYFPSHLHAVYTRKSNGTETFTSIMGYPHN